MNLFEDLSSSFEGLESIYFTWKTVGNLNSTGYIDGVEIGKLVQVLRRGTTKYRNLWSQMPFLLQGFIVLK